MKRILITGKNSYIGHYLIDNLLSHKGEYDVDELDLTKPDWEKYPFSKYDTVYHVAGIAHSDYGKISKEKEELYKRVNTDLTIKCALEAKKAGVKQFIFMSSAIVFGGSSRIGKANVYDLSSPTNPENCYGQSKLDAENGLRELEDDNFKVCIIRSPMVYGKDSKGNFPSLEKIATKLPFFPYIKNERSVIYVKNLVEFVRLLIDNSDSGTFMPQNKEYMNTSEMIRLIAKIKGKKLRLIKSFGWLIVLASLILKKLKKAFGNMTYSKEVSAYKNEYCLYSLEESLKDMYLK